MISDVKARRKTNIDRRAAVLEATLRLGAKHGLANVPTAAISREAGVATGTLFVYFENKEALFNALYVDLIQRRYDCLTEGLDGRREDLMHAFWHNSARWYIDHADESRLVQQCESSSLLTAESLAFRDRLDERMTLEHFPDVVELFSLPLRRQVIYSILVGPLVVLAQLRDKGEIAITDELLEQTYERVRIALGMENHQTTTSLT